MRTVRSYILCLVLLTTFFLSYGLPRPKYESFAILKNLNIPETLNDWRSEDVSKELNLQKDDRYNFISDIFARIYGTRDGRSLLFLVLDAGNFHHPKVCFNSSGFELKELEDTAFDLPQNQFKAATLFSEKGKEGFVVIYWICIDQKRVDWTEQKITQFWFSLFNKKKVGLMVRMDIPTDREHVAQAIQLGQQFIRDIQPALSAQQADYLFGKN